VKNRLRVLRAERDWSQARLAEELAVSRQTVNAIENGKYDPSLPLAFRIARLFGMRIEDVFFPEEAAPPAKAPPPEEEAPEPVGRTSVPVSSEWP
jgi:putative transcriptional regulator